MAAAASANDDPPGECDCCTGHYDNQNHRPISQPLQLSPAVLS